MQVGALKLVQDMQGHSPAEEAQEETGTGWPGAQESRVWALPPGDQQREDSATTQPAILHAS